MDKVIAALRDDLTRARAAAEQSRDCAKAYRSRADEADANAAQSEAYAQECEAAIARLSPTPTAAAA